MMPSPPHKPTTRDLCQQATDLVRSFSVEPAERAPAFTLPRPAPRSPAAGAGPIEGLPGDLWATRDDLRAGSTSVREVIDGALRRIAGYNAAFGALEQVADVTERAATLDGEARRGEWRGPLHGLPVSVKDVIDVAGLRTTGSSVAIEGYIAPADATAVARLRDAGALITGKAATHEFALGVTTSQARHPWAPERIPGGSSGGSAISLATGMALGSLGTDTRASIRVPAALTGMAGFKPSLGLIPIDRWLTLSWTMDHFAPMARSVRDVALLMDVLTAETRYTAALPGTLAGVRIGYAPELLRNTDEEVAERFDESVAVMATAGASVCEVSRPDALDMDLVNAAGLLVSRAEAATFHAQRGTDLEAVLTGSPRPAPVRLRTHGHRLCATTPGARLPARAARAHLR